MKLVFLFAKKYFFSRGTTNAINLISGVSVLGIVVGSAGLILVLSVFNGFEDLVISLYNKFYPELVVMPAEGKTFVVDSMMLSKIKSVAGVRDVALSLEENALVKFGKNQVVATVKGVDTHYAEVSGIPSTIIRGKYFIDNNQTAVIGLGVESFLAVDVNDPLAEISILVPKPVHSGSILDNAPFAQLVMKPAGTFAIQQDFDSKYVFVSLAAARQLLNREGQAGQIEIALNKNIRVSDVQEKIKSICGARFIIKNRIQQNSVLYQIMTVEKWATYAVLTFILIVAAFNMIGSLSMLVIEKRHDMAIVQAMGGTKKTVRNIFIAEGVALSLFGCLIGFLISSLLCVLQQQFGWLKMGGETFVINMYPVAMRASDFILVLLTVLVIGFLASWLPAARASKGSRQLMLY